MKSIISTLMALCRLIPIKPFLFCCSQLGATTALFCKRDLRITSLQSSLAYNELNETVPFKPVDVMASAGKAVGEAVMIPNLLSSSKFELEGDSEEILLEGEKEGSMVLSGHLGCFELLAGYYIDRGLDLYVVGRKPNYQLLDTWLVCLRESYRNKTIWREDKRSTSKLLRALKDGGTIASLIDQDTKLENGFAKFFGVDAASPIVPIRLAIKFKKPIFSCFFAREKSLNGALQFIIMTKRISYDPSDPQAESKVLTQYNLELERAIQRFPEQWVWWHRRWRRKPGVDYELEPDSLPSTKEYMNWLESRL